ncbi:MAG: DUF192 domain-containing protein [Alphaproteobacteria bacterium]|nr:DUF192 domain-containing protein [Alphaproteobacteria bacterium]
MSAQIERLTVRWAWMLVAAFLAAAAAPAVQADDAPAGIPQSLPLVPLVIETRAGDVPLQVQVADTDDTQAYGLMFRTKMPETEGMLFVFENPRFVTFWMKNTPIPLDMLFVDEGGTVTQIVTSTTPYSLDPIPSDGAAKAVLELNGGAATRLGIARGDHLRHPAFSDASAPQPAPAP